MEDHALDRRHFSKTSVALRTVAMFEVIKAAIVLLLGCGLFRLMHKNLDDVAERVVQVFRVYPEGKLSNLFFELASHASDRNLWLLALGTLAYASVRSTEAYGLWREREWAQWFSLLSTALYLPPELYWILRDPSWLKCAVLVTNIAIFLFMLSLRVNRHSSCPQHPAAILHAHRRSVSRGQRFRRAFVIPYRRWRSHQLICVITTEVEDRHRTSDGERKWN
jgi:uncharacterized membrane protein (DUF2068 family)